MKLVKKTKHIGHNCNVTGYEGGMPYLKAESGAVDGIGRHHIKLSFICDECGKKNVVAYVHGDKDGKIV